MSITLATPGVYIDERSVFPNSVASVPTAIPAFIGYTEIASRNGKSLAKMPTRITSLAEYKSLFGAGPKSKFVIAETPKPDQNAKGPAPTGDFSAGGTNYDLSLDASTPPFMLYNAIRFFYANGGGTCYIVSVGTYGDGTAKGIKRSDMEPAITELAMHPEPTMLVIPEAILVTDPADCYGLQQTMIDHCGNKMKSRIAILDVYNGNKKRTYDDADIITVFRTGVDTNFPDFAAAYYPWLETSIVQANEIDFRSVDATKLIEILNKEVDASKMDDATKTKLKAEYAAAATTTDDKKADLLHQLMVTQSAVYKNIMLAIRKKLNLLPPSPAMAGIYTMVDNNRAVWKAPANVAISSVSAPAVHLSDDDQQDLNVTLSGKSVNAIRSFTGEGIKCWGARTMAGNSQDWKYINVRRTLIFLEQSIKAAAKAYVFEPNDSKTWISIKGMIGNFLNDVWKQGGLVGAKPDEAYLVDVGLGTTMTAVDILEGVMRITVKVAVSHPAEFIVITFEQKMQES